MKKLFPVIVFILGMASARAQSCGCTYTITKTGVYDGAALKIGPGAKVCIKGGVYQYLRLNNFTGAPGKPITFINCEGLVDFSSTLTTQSGLNVQASRYFRITGTGDSQYQYGIKVSKTGVDATALNILARSSDCEVDHVEIASAGFAGIMAKTDPKCDPATQRGGFVMYNVKIHDNFVHDTKGEGFYIGHSNWGNGVYQTCNGVQVTVYPHEIIGLELYNNITDHTGAEGLQFSCSIDAQVHDNTVRWAGVSPFGVNQNNGVQIGGGTSGRFYNNTIQNAQGDGISMLGHRGPNYIFNNIVANSGINGLYIDNRTGTPTGPDVVVANNTFVTAADAGMRFYNETNNNYATNNVIVGVPPAKAILMTNNSFPLVKQNNMTSASVSDARFVNAAAGNYHLTATSPLINAGKDVRSWGITFDLDNVARPQGGGWDIGAYEFVSTPAARLAAAESGDPVRLRVYPSPAQEWLVVRLSTGAPLTDLVVMDAGGHTVHQAPAGLLADEVTVAVGHLPTGLYLLRVKAGNGWHTERFLKQ